ncbi:hypothetical protein SAMN05216188_101886 [Lentzea xinjiangensis]|uniref:Uncharacterized protein n=1 Tax=Lentzea xinjiangensis TaxID=402600 RepID=A0A1H9BQL1_9PSEU|nr:hypothetical protein [Lentzea xinjiangensis]SEP91236.1 hypothetical protein SAMN05216188_101886 [Lentzea xinjiangensis]
MSRSATASLAALGVNPASELTSTTTDHTTGRVLPVRGELAGLLSWGGLRRGSTVSVGGSTSLLLALLADATADGCWAAVVGLPQVGVLAAAELGVSVRRLALVPHPGADPGPVIAALLDGIDLVAVACPLPPSLARRLTARARQRRAVLIAFGSWPSADVELTAESVRWNPLDDGAETLRRQQISVCSGGRGPAGRPRRVLLTFGEGEIELPLVAGEPARSDEPADAGPDRGDEPAARRAGGADELAARRVADRPVKRAGTAPVVRPEAAGVARRAGGDPLPGGDPALVRAGEPAGRASPGAGRRPAARSIVETLGAPLATLADTAAEPPA